MGRGKFKAKPTGQRHFSTPEEMLAGTSSRPRTFKRQEAAYKEEEESEEESGQESGEESEDETEQKRKGTQGVIEVNNPNLVKPKNLKARDLDAGKTTELSRRERFVKYALSFLFVLCFWYFQVMVCFLFILCSIIYILSNCL
uniref:Casein kinase substrate phosphoprotein PP28 domain-containing protein n=1 Tax=Gossypium raimondii TaxID=29730 RepID=A0A0D2RE62_GOSRA|nr:hypothetical protein B456_011G031100 [Gossypium raimondii]